MMESTSLALNAATKRWVRASIAALASLVPAASAAETSAAAPLRARAVSATHDDSRIRFMRSPRYYFRRRSHARCLSMRAILDKAQAPAGGTQGPPAGVSPLRAWLPCLLEDGYLLGPRAEDRADLVALDR